MRLRLVPVLALSLLTLGVSSSSSATAKPTIDPFLGDWTMTSEADDALAGNGLEIKESNAAEAKSLVGPEWTNSTGTAYYDQYCGSKATVYAYVVIQYSWPPKGSMGGCLSSKTGPHIVFAGSEKEAGSARVVSAGGLDELTGTWDTIVNGDCCVHHEISGGRPSVAFTVGEQGHLAQPKKKNGPKFLLTKLLGVGAVSLVDGRTDEDGVYDAGISDATGTIHFHKWRVYEHGVIDEDQLVLAVQKADRGLYRKASELEMVNNVGVVVTKSEHGETDDCPVGAAGTLTMIEMTSGSNKGKDLVTLTIARCGVNESFVNGSKSAKVAVGLTFEKP